MTPTAAPSSSIPSANLTLERRRVIVCTGAAAPSSAVGVDVDVDVGRTSSLTALVTTASASYGWTRLLLRRDHGRGERPPTPR
jgi:hypothetical protein